MRRQPTRRTATQPTTTREPEPPPRPHHYPEWYRPEHRFTDVQHSSHSVRALVEDAESGTFRLPRFQRDFVWRDEQIVRLFDSMIHGYHCGSLLLWRRYGLAASVERIGAVSIDSPAAPYGHMLVVDGQQRLGSILTAALSGRWHFDLQAGEITPSGPGAWRFPCDIALRRGTTRASLDWYSEHAAQYGLDAEHVYDAMLAMLDRIEHCYVSNVLLGHDWTMPRVIESYRRLNSEGTAMDPAMLADGIARALQGEP